MLQYNSTASSPSPVKGFEREIFIGELLSTMVPPPYRIGTGIIVDSYENTSTQTDIVVEFPYGIRFPIGTGTTSMYLAESVAASIEVKSNFVKQWGDIHDKIHGNRSLIRRQRKAGSVVSDDDRIQLSSNVHLPIFIVAYKGPKQIKTIYNYMARLNRTLPTGVLIIDSAIYVGGAPNGGWFEAKGKAESIFAFMAHLTDWMRHDVTYTWDLGHYLQDEPQKPRAKRGANMKNRAR
jgi:hypothetical protein